MNILSDSSGDQTDLLYVNFNQETGCFSCGTTRGFEIYNVDPCREIFRRIFSNGGIGIVEMLFRTNLLALVGGGRNPRYPTSKVMIWDDQHNKCIGELKFRTEVKAVKLRRDRIVVVLETKVFVYRFKDLQLLDQITTVANPKGLVSLCPEAKSIVLAIPGLQRGSIRIELYDSSKATLIKAHDADLAQFALNVDGSRIASASEKGTLIRIWNCFTGEPLRELRRGVDRADIYCICFNLASTYVACSSDKGTVHIFSLTATPVPRRADGHGAENTALTGDYSATNREYGGRTDSVSSKVTATTTTASSASNNNNNRPTVSTDSTVSPLETHHAASSPIPSYLDNTTNNKSMTGIGINFLKGFLPTGLVPKYFESEWSFGQVRGIEGKSICAFSKDSSKIHIISSDGQFIVANVEEGECIRMSTTRFFKRVGDQDRNPDGEDLSWANK
jgi:WD40 repeat protein